ncbi:MAG TPA: phosphate ABC transporter permease subunit PstC [Pyrinomonadaceae bacterium]|jgi:phosphate transport system permease protein|nr:phosphate ABC transporter permease subunit PstC [Pyrinomonadaceae bacterium]
MSNPAPTNPSPASEYGARFRAWDWRRALSPTGNVGDAVFRGALFLCALLLVVVVALMFVEIGSNARLSIERFGLPFLTGRNWEPIRDEFGALPFVYGTVVSSLLALLLAVPVSLGIAIFLVEQAPRRLARPLAFLVELLAAIPSVVYGLWGIFVLAPTLREHVGPPLQAWLGWLPFFRGTVTGIGLLTGGVILAIMVTPIITAVVRDVLAAVPVSQREAALALGATSWETTRIVLANGAPGIAGAIILGLGRAVGETMAVTMVIGNRPEISVSLFEPSYTIASVIANEFTEATGDLYLSALVELGLVLFLVTFVINGAARLLVWSVTRGTSGVARA